MEKIKEGNILMQRYEIGKLLGQGTFAKVHHARNVETGKSTAIKVIDKEKVLKVGLIDQIKREISVMRLVRHPNVVQLYEVMASKSKIYFAIEYVKGGELFNKVAKGRLKEDVARKYFQQLIAAVDFCHSRGVYHRDLKPENLLLDEFGNLKVTDFGLSALINSKHQDGLLHTTCGTPAYVAPEVINKRGYDGEKADIWSCGVVLYVLLAGFLPFHDQNLMELYKKISKGEFKCPHWFPPEVRKLLQKILDPNPATRITLLKIMENPWFRKGFEETASMPPSPSIETGNVEDSSPRSVLDVLNLDDFDSSPIKEKEVEKRRLTRPNSMNAFDLISLSPGFNLSGLFEDSNSNSKQREAWFTTKLPPSEVVSKLEEAIASTAEKFKIKKEEGVVKMEGSRKGRKGQLSIDAEIFEVAPSLHMVELKKTGGDTMEYLKFRDQELRPSLKDIVWSWQGGLQSQDPDKQPPAVRE
ncbi:CBL-interacting serine/threonine-protein kinase 20-like [Andrographis paniculata]|uniref:CBL-interacting serine/threonine-protein kinase 20-like n=1 Tax=Andrographis paniculata TaxID=175694 RepID=UPI0021E8E41F|nr:CBL-interacting serine/threonine-protein kinase 20-like [Andrographis paniculata]